jgi:3-oxoacyl-(acyl-carrier-protein) synthase
LGDKKETLSAMLSGECGLKYSAEWQMHVGLSDVKIIDGFTRFESLMVEQLNNVVKESGVDLSSADTQLIISTTKGNIDYLAQDCEQIPERTFIDASANVIAEHFGCVNKPIIISNACISGVSAFVVARWVLNSTECKHVVVVGADALCEFITSGFASFKSISPAPCKPYDATRDGLTLGEAAGAVLLTKDVAMSDGSGIRLSGGAISNDANHISGPSRTGDGLFYAIANAMNEAGVESEDIGFVNTHGTATRYNDEMESKAIAWACLDDKPLNSVKGYIGHTLGASGVVETIICAEELKSGVVFGTKGFTESDTPHKLTLSSDSQSFEKQCCVKTASGFGGCNAAIVLDKEDHVAPSNNLARTSTVVAEYTLPQSDIEFADFIRAEFKSFGDSNMKFYKMSDMSKALYVAVENLLKIEGFNDVEQTRRAIVLANKSASLDADIIHQRILNKRLPEGASPAAFVYTLANVAAGEICIRHKIQGDNTFFIEDKDSGLTEKYATSLIENDKADAVIYGWCEYLQGKWNVNIKLLKNK